MATCLDLMDNLVEGQDPIMDTSPLQKYCLEGMI